MWGAYRISWVNFTSYSTTVLSPYSSCSNSDTSLSWMHWGKVFFEEHFTYFLSFWTQASVFSGSVLPRNSGGFSLLGFCISVISSYSVGAGTYVCLYYLRFSIKASIIHSSLLILRSEDSVSFTILALSLVYTQQGDYQSRRGSYWLHVLFHIRRVYAFNSTQVRSHDPLLPHVHNHIDSIFGINIHIACYTT